MTGKRQYERLNNESCLLKAVANGDQRAFRSLVEAYWSQVFGNTLALVKSTAIAQELTQDIFLKIWTQREKLATVNSFVHYIYVVGRNQVISAMRKKVAVTVSVDDEDLAESLFLPDLQFECKETHNLIWGGVEQLTPQQKLIFKLSRLQGLSHEDIATQLNLSKNTVKVHMVAALNALRVYIKEHVGELLTLVVLFFIKIFLRN